MVLMLIRFLICWRSACSVFFFFNDTATTEIYTLSLHDALPILMTVTPFQVTVKRGVGSLVNRHMKCSHRRLVKEPLLSVDRKSTRLNSSHGYISYAVFCLKKKK